MDAKSAFCVVEGFRGRCPSRCRRHHRSRSLNELIPDWKRKRRAADAHSDERTGFVPDRGKRPSTCRLPLRISTTIRTTFASLGEVVAGWRNWRKIWAWKSIRALPLLVLYHEQFRSKACDHGNMGVGKTANRPIHSSQAWSFGRNKPYLPKNCRETRFQANHQNASSSAKTTSRKLTRLGH